MTAALCDRWQPGVTLLPATDDRLETHVVVDIDGERKAVHFQEWWVRYRGQVPTHRFVFVGAEARTSTAFELSAATGEVRAIRAGVERFSAGRGDARPWSAGGEAYYLMLDDDGLAIRDVRTETTHELEPSGVSIIAL